MRYGVLKVRNNVTKISMHKTSLFLRVLAQQIDNNSEETPDFFICAISQNSEITSTHRAVNSPFELLGSVEYRKLLLIDDIEK